MKISDESQVLLGVFHELSDDFGLPYTLGVIEYSGVCGIKELDDEMIDTYFRDVVEKRVKKTVLEDVYCRVKNHIKDLGSRGICGVYGYKSN